MHRKTSAVLGVLLTTVAFVTFTASASATTITPANTATAITGTASFVTNNGMGASVTCTTVSAAATTPTSTGGTPANNAGDTTTPGAAGFTIANKPEFTNCTYNGTPSAAATIATSVAHGGWYFSAETFASGAIVGIVGLPEAVGTIDFTSMARSCHIDLNPTMVVQLQGLWTNGAGPNLAISQNQLDFTGNADCVALGIANGSPIQLSMNLTFANSAITIAM